MAVAMSLLPTQDNCLLLKAAVVTTLRCPKMSFQRVGITAPNRTSHLDKMALFHRTTLRVLCRLLQLLLTTQLQLQACWALEHKKMPLEHRLVWHHSLRLSESVILKRGQKLLVGCSCRLLQATRHTARLPQEISDRRPSLLRRLMKTLITALVLPTPLLWMELRV